MKVIDIHQILGGTLLDYLLFAIITTVPFMWGMQTPALNVLFTLYLGLIILRLSDQMENRLVFYILFFAACLGSIFMDWGLVGIPMIFLFKKLKGKKGQYFVPLLPSISVAILQFVNSLLDPNLTMHNSIQSICFAIVGGLLVIPLLSNYNGERGRKAKYLFYLYYPVHLIILGIIRGVLLSDWGLF